MTDALIAAVEIYVLFMAVALIVAGGIRFRKHREMKHARKMQARQWAQQGRWLTEQQQRRQQARATRQ